MNAINWIVDVHAWKVVADQITESPPSVVPAPAPQGTKPSGGVNVRTSANVDDPRVRIGSLAGGVAAIAAARHGAAAPSPTPTVRPTPSLRGSKLPKVDTALAEPSPPPPPPSTDYDFDMPPPPPPAALEELDFDPATLPPPPALQFEDGDIDPPPPPPGDGSGADAASPAIASLDETRLTAPTLGTQSRRRSSDLGLNTLAGIRRVMHRKTVKTATGKRPPTVKKKPVWRPAPPPAATKPTSRVVKVPPQPPKKSPAIRPKPRPTSTYEDGPKTAAASPPVPQARPRPSQRRA